MVTRYVRSWSRLIGFALFTTIWILLYPVGRLLARNSHRAQIKWRAVWMKVMLPFLGIRILRRGSLPPSEEVVIYVGNHRSYLDPIAALGLTRSVVVAKSEVARWPIIGAACRIAGVIFVARADKSSRSAALQKMEALLRKGIPVLVYPEGTTIKAPGFLPFRAGAFELAAKLQTPVIPIAMEFEDPNVAWTGDDTFLPHFLQTFGRPTINVLLSFGAPMIHQDGMKLMHEVHLWIGAELKKLQ